MQDVTAQLKIIVSDMVFQIAALKAENEMLKEKLAEAVSDKAPSEASQDRA
jgi:regulator of replication initiation timing